MVGMEAHGGGSRSLDGAAAPLPVLLPVIPVGSLGSGRGQNREEALVCFQAVLRRAIFLLGGIPQWNIPKRSQPPTSASSANQHLSSAQIFFRYSSVSCLTTEETQTFYPYYSSDELLESKLKRRS